MKKIIFAITTIAAGLFATSCNDLLDIPQHGTLNYETYYQTDEEAETAATAMYIELRGLEYNFTLGKNMLGDDFWAGGGGRNDNAELEQLNEFTFGTEQSMLQGMFQSYYRIIYKANVVLGHVQGDSPVMQRTIAEAKVFRAWAYFELISMWGNPPLVDHELTPDEYSCPNGTTEELWGLVEKDLTEAIASGYLPEKKGVEDKSTWKVTKQFAQAVLGKAYLWQKKYTEAAKEFQNVIDSKLYALDYSVSYEDLYYNEMSCESMLESIRIDDANNVWANNMSLVGLMIHYRTDKMKISSDLGLYQMGWGFLNPQKNLYDDFVKVEGENGYRLNQTIKTRNQMADLGATVNIGESIVNEGYFMWKWRVRSELIPSEGYGFCMNTNPKWMRYAEVLLLAAEAYLMAGDAGKALTCINEVRTRAQLAPLGGVTLDDIIIEKRLELCGECLRFQDMIRWGIAAERMAKQGEHSPYLDSNGKVEYKVFNQDPSKYGFKERHNLLPYPGAEIRLNPNIVQNPGW